MKVVVGVLVVVQSLILIALICLGLVFHWARL
jgi:hypothetical protein